MICMQNIFTDEISISVGIGVVKGKKYLQVMYSDALRKKVKNWKNNRLIFIKDSQKV